MGFFSKVFGQNNSPTQQTLNHKDQPLSTFPPKLSTEEEMKELENHYEKYIGKINTVFHEMISTDIHVDVYHFLPTKDHPFHTLATGGMSAKAMTVPKNDKSLMYTELLICLPEDWKISQNDFSNENNYWPVRLLKTLARFPHEYRTWLGLYHTLPNGNPSKPYANNTKLECAYITGPYMLDPKIFKLHINNDKTIHVFAVFPLYNSEMEFKLKNGGQKLDELFDQKLGTYIVKPDRPVVV